jgi:hypothetical protein
MLDGEASEAFDPADRWRAAAAFLAGTQSVADDADVRIGLVWSGSAVGAGAVTAVVLGPVQG